ncbi:glycosyltransferase [uncultured Agrobacterium sp.]|uniref:glycosyltransferase n=1 Tax=uncultured Agrobacterium sp. TaxID=157277 RepID=UPI0025E26C53|nr:glycosyltransferase [uncultured Agrobacterium sp.]
MKIIHVIAAIDPKYGGLQAVAMRLAAAQAGLGLDVHIVSHGDDAIEAQVKEIGRSIPHFEHVHWHLLPPAGSMETLFCFSGRRVLKALLKDASFMHIHGVWEPFLLYASKLARAARVPYCICPAGMLDHWSLGQRSWKKKIALMLCYRKMLNEAAFLHLLNIDEMAAVAPLKFHARNLIIPNGVFAEEFDPLPARGHFKRKIALAHGRRYILFLSRLHVKKGIDILASAFAAICETYVDVDLVVAGPPGGAEGQFMHLVNKLNIRNRVFMVGAIYGEAKLQAMVDADCFCLPSRQEGFSMAITEALACATPVVITDQCHFPEVGSADAGVIVAVDAAEVAKGLATVLSNPAKARTMGENGRRLVLEKFTWPSIAQATLEGYRLSALEAAAS